MRKQDGKVNGFGQQPVCLKRSQKKACVRRVSGMDATDGLVCPFHALHVLHDMALYRALVSGNNCRVAAVWIVAET
jgi:hypothetical protein